MSQLSTLRFIAYAKSLFTTPVGSSPEISRMDPIIKFQTLTHSYKPAHSTLPTSQTLSQSTSPPPPPRYQNKTQPDLRPGEDPQYHLENS